MPRAREIRLRALNRKGERIEQSWTDFRARVVQHETDHLNGLVYLDRMDGLKTLAYMSEMGRHG